MTIWPNSPQIPKIKTFSRAFIIFLCFIWNKSSSNKTLYSKKFEKYHSICNNYFFLTAQLMYWEKINFDHSLRCLKNCQENYLFIFVSTFIFTSTAILKYSSSSTLNSNFYRIIKMLQRSYPEYWKYLPEISCKCTNLRRFETAIQCLLVLA